MSLKNLKTKKSLRFAYDNSWPSYYKKSQYFRVKQPAIAFLSKVSRKSIQRIQILRYSQSERDTFWHKMSHCARPKYIIVGASLYLGKKQWIINLKSPNLKNVTKIEFETESRPNQKFFKIYLLAMKTFSRSHTLTLHSSFYIMKGGGSFGKLNQRELNIKLTKDISYQIELQNLNTLNVSLINNSSDLGNLFKAVQKSPLEELSFFAERTILKDEFVFGICEILDKKSLKVLSIVCKDSNIQSEIIEILFQALSKLKNMEKLRLIFENLLFQNNPINELILKYLLKPQNFVNINQISFGISPMRENMKEYSQSLSKWIVSNKTLSSLGISFPLEEPPQNKYFFEKFITSRESNKIFEAFSEANSIIKLTLHCVTFWKISEFAIAINALTKMSNLTSLDLRLKGQEFKDIGLIPLNEIRELRENLKTFSSLDSLSIVSLGIPSFIVFQLLRSGRKTKKLKLIIERDTHSVVDPRDAIALYRIIDEMKSLESFEFRASLFYDGLHLLKELKVKNKDITSH